MFLGVCVREKKKREEGEKYTYPRQSLPDYHFPLWMVSLSVTVVYENVFSTYSSL